MNPFLKNATSKFAKYGFLAIIKNTRRACIYMSIVPSICVPERNQHSRGYRVNLAVRQDSLNGVWISSEKSSRRLNSRTTVK